jgi:hypothetical protein
MEPVLLTAVSNVPRVSCSVPKVGAESSLQSKVVSSMITSTLIDVPPAPPIGCSSTPVAISNHKIVKFLTKINNVSHANLGSLWLEAVATLSKYKTVHLAHFPLKDTVNLWLLKIVSVLKAVI